MIDFFRRNGVRIIDYWAMIILYDSNGDRRANEASTTVQHADEAGRVAR
jgi:hypothetical protein